MSGPIFSVSVDPSQGFRPVRIAHETARGVVGLFEGEARDLARDLLDACDVIQQQHGAVDGKDTEEGSSKTPHETAFPDRYEKSNVGGQAASSPASPTRESICVLCQKPMGDGLRDDGLEWRHEACEQKREAISQESAIEAARRDERIECAILVASEGAKCVPEFPASFNLNQYDIQVMRKWFADIAKAILARGAK